MNELNPNPESEESKELDPTYLASLNKTIAGTNETVTGFIVAEAQDKGIEIPPEVGEELEKARKILQETGNRLDEIRQSLNTTNGPE